MSLFWIETLPVLALTHSDRNFRAYRVIAMSVTLSVQAKSPPSHCIQRDALLLTAACTWLINGLHARPDGGPASRNLMRAVLPVMELDDTDDITLAYPVSNPSRGRGEGRREQ